MPLGLTPSMFCMCWRFNGVFRLKSEKFFKEILKKGLTNRTRYAKIITTKGRSEDLKSSGFQKKFEKVFQKDLTNSPLRVIITVRCEALNSGACINQNGDNRKGAPN